MKKVLIVQRVLSHYNIPLYEAMKEDYDVTLAYSEKSEDRENRVKSIEIDYPTGGEWRGMSEESFELHIHNLISVCKNYDVVILPMEPYRMALHVMEKLRKCAKIILWGIGVSASYDIRYDSQELRKPSFESMVAMADAAVFYTSYPKNKYQEFGIPGEKMFVAPNTVKVLEIETEEQHKDSLLFVGTLLKQKRVDLLLEAYENAFQKNAHIPVLKIIGEGEEYENICQWIDKHDMSEKILLMGPIYDEDILKEQFLHAFATISTEQAGLSVLKSMGYGVPFITNKNAITGGEIFNIDNGVNGVLFEETSELETILLDIAENPNKYKIMGEKAYQHYHSCRTVQDCKRGFVEAIEYATREK